jgi:oligopeptide transport system substrate-binding protein
VKGGGSSPTLFETAAGRRLIGAVAGHRSRRGSSLFRASWLVDYNDAYGFLQVLKGGFGINLPHYANGAYDDLLERASNEDHDSRRQSLLQNAESLMLNDQPLIPLYFYVSKHLVGENVHGWRNNVMHIVDSKDLAKTGAAAEK